MKIIDNEATFNAALPSMAPAVSRLLIERRDQLLADLDPETGMDGFATFAIVQPNDTLSAVEAAVGFPIARDYPPWEWVLDHGDLYEAPVILSDDGAGIILIVPDCPGVDAILLGLLRAYAEPADANSAD